MKKSFRREIIIGFWLMVFLCFFIGGISVITALNMQKVFRDTITENVSALKAAEELEIALLSQKGFVANYFLSGDPIWLNRLEEAKADFATWFNKASSTARTPAEKNIIEEINHFYKTYEKDRHRAKQLYESGNMREAKNILLVDMWADLDKVYQSCESFILINESIIEKSRADLRKSIIGMITIIFISSLGIIALIGGMFLFLIKRILGSIENVTVTARGVNLNSLNRRLDTANLEEEMIGLVQSFNAMLERLGQSFEYIKEFSMSIGHELKTPLAIIKGESQIALRRERQVEDYRKALSVNIEEANRMINIVEDLALLTKLDYNPNNIKKEVFDFILFFTDIEKRAQTLVSQEQITLSVTMPAIPVTLEGSKLHLSRLFFNLIQNAIKFTPPGGKISLSVLSQGGILKVSVSDTGVGISEEDLPKIFNRFFQKEKSQSESSSSVGLGLSIAKSIARFHNGDIEVESKLKQGSTFTVILPTCPS